MVYALVVFTILLYNGFFLFASNLLPFILISTFLHAIQYHLIAGKKTMAVLEYESGDDNNGMTLIQNGIRRITSNSISWSLVVVLGSLLVFLLNEVSYGVIPLTWAMQHFYLDSQIWKRPSKNPKRI